MALVQRRRNADEEESGVYFSRFVQENAPDIAGAVISDSGRSTASANVSSIAQELDAIAESFANSPERQRLRQTAQKAAREGITLSQIKDIIRSIMSGGRHLVERLVVCFFFCLDLLKGVAQWVWSKLTQIFSWCWDAISTIAGAIISAAGGLVRLVGSGVSYIVESLFG